MRVGFNYLNAVIEWNENIPKWKWNTMRLQYDNETLSLIISYNIISYLRNCIWVEQVWHSGYNLPPRNIEWISPIRSRWTMRTSSCENSYTWEHREIHAIVCTVRAYVRTFSILIFHVILFLSIYYQCSVRSYFIFFSVAYFALYRYNSLTLREACKVFVAEHGPELRQVDTHIELVSHMPHNGDHIVLILIICLQQATFCPVILRIRSLSSYHYHYLLTFVFIIISHFFFYIFSFSNFFNFSLFLLFSILLYFITGYFVSSRDWTIPRTWTFNSRCNAGGWDRQ